MKIELQSIETLKPYERNPRKNDPAVDAVAKSIKEFGFRQPIVIDKNGTIVAGHTRLKAARKLGLKTVPVHRAEDLTEDQIKAYRIADNQSASIAEWDFDLLPEEIRELENVNFDLDVLGFSEREIEDMLREESKIEEEIPEPPKDPITKPGDLWILGDHRLLCGDSTKEEDVDRCLSGFIPFICVTDPPYGVNYDASWRDRAADKGHLQFAARRVVKVTNDDRSDWSETWKLFPGDVLYSWHPSGATSVIHANAIETSGFSLRMQIIWSKSNFVIGRGDYQIRHEPCWYAVRTGKKSRRTKDRTQTTLWEINLDKNVEGGHSTQKPVECMARPIRNHESDSVYEPFSGSGTTIIAAEQLNRRCFAIEIEPRYVDVAIQRWENYTGGKAKREKP